MTPPKKLDADELAAWDRYVCAMLPAMVSRLETRDLDQWRDMPRIIGLLAEVLLDERQKREKADG